MFIIPNKIIKNTFFNEYMEENECYGTFPPGLTHKFAHKLQSLRALISAKWISMLPYVSMFNKL